MTTRWLLASIHLVALGIGLGAVWGRYRALRGVLDLAGLKRVLVADAWWGIAAVLWIATGLVRAFAGYEKGSGYYLHNDLFIAKMLMLVVILGLELTLWPLLRWRVTVARGDVPDVAAAGRFAKISAVQAALVVLMVIAATGLARGMGVSR